MKSSNVLLLNAENALISLYNLVTVSIDSLFPLIICLPNLKRVTVNYKDLSMRSAAVYRKFSKLKLN